MPSYTVTIVVLLIVILAAAILVVTVDPDTEITIDDHRVIERSKGGAIKTVRIDKNTRADCGLPIYGNAILNVIDPHRSEVSIRINVLTEDLRRKIGEAFIENGDIDLVDKRARKAMHIDMN